MINSCLHPHCHLHQTSSCYYLSLGPLMELPNKTPGSQLGLSHPSPRTGRIMSVPCRRCTVYLAQFPEILAGLLLGISSSCCCCTDLFRDHPPCFASSSCTHLGLLDLFLMNPDLSSPFYFSSMAPKICSFLFICLAVHLISVNSVVAICFVSFM